MRYEDAARRLAVLPSRLPEPPRALAPRVWLADGSPVDLTSREQDLDPLDAAVLVLVYPDADGEAHVLLMERPAGDLRHAGEVSFPGGAVEPEDATLVDAAIREAREEVGLDPEACGLRVLGTLESVNVRVSGFRLVPVLALASRRPALRPDPREVADVIEAPLRHFLPDAPIEQVEQTRDSWHLRYGAYPVQGRNVWGATARVLGQLGALLRS